MKYYISDLHFFNPAFLPWRGFSTLEEENRVLTGRWNARVTEEDEVYILGDFSEGSAEETNRLLRALHGQKTLLIGNHDEYLASPSFDRALFREITHYKELEDGGIRVILSHYPLPFYNGQYRHLSDPSAVTYMLYGHLHCTYDETLLNDYLTSSASRTREMQGVEDPVPVVCNMINCCCYLCAYSPFSLPEWIEEDRRRRAKLNARNKEFGSFAQK